MKKFSIIAVMALIGLAPVNAQEFALANTQWDDFSTISLSEIDGLTLKSESESASTFEIQDVTFGIIGGLICSTLYGDEADSFDNRISFHFGVMMMIAFSQDFALQTELLYAGMGSGYEVQGFDFGEFETYRGGGGDITGTYKLDYIILLIAAKYYVAKGLSVEAGPQFGVLISAKDDYEFDGISEEEDVKDQTKGFDVGVSGGVGYEFDMGLYLKLRYYLGLTEVNDFNFPGNESWKNGALFASAGFFFN